MATVYVLCGYKHEVIRQYFGDGESVGMSLHYVVEEEPLGRGGALKRGLSLLPPGLEMVVVTNGDIITDQSLEELVRAHQESKGLATVMLSFPPSPGRASYIPSRALPSGWQWIR